MFLCFSVATMAIPYVCINATTADGLGQLNVRRLPCVHVKYHSSIFFLDDVYCAYFASDILYYAPILKDTYTFSVMLI